MSEDVREYVGRAIDEAHPGLPGNAPPDDHRGGRDARWNGIDGCAAVVGFGVDASG